MDADIRAVLPHRYPFLLVDRLISVDGDEFECLKNVTYNEPFFTGHFPAEPVMPGVLIIEALAQAAGLAIASGAADNPEIGRASCRERHRYMAVRASHE